MTESIVDPILLAIFWDPSPVAISLPFLSIYWYSLFFATGFLFATYISKKILLPTTLSENEYDHFVWYIFLGMLIGARLGHVIFYDLSYYLNNPEEIIMIWKGGLASHGAVLGMIGAIWLFSKRYHKNMYKLFDVTALVAPLAGGCIRIGNFFNQEIVGTPSSLPWAVIFGHPMEYIPHIPVHPVQLYEAIFYFILFGIGMWLFYRTRTGQLPGRITGIQILAIFLGRVCLEFFKAPQSATDTYFISTGQSLSIPFIILGLYLILRKDVKSNANNL